MDLGVAVAAVGKHEWAECTTGATVRVLCPGCQRLPALVSGLSFVLLALLSRCPSVTQNVFSCLEFGDSEMCRGIEDTPQMNLRQHGHT